MFEHVCGKLSQKSPVFAIVECGGVGYFLNISVATYDALPKEGNQVRLMTHLVHRDDVMELYGFATAHERDFFRKLIAVTRVGPKLALSILSGGTPQRLATAIAAGDVATLSKIPKVGKKTAERIVLELKGKIEIPVGEIVEDETISAAVSALVSLGFSRTEAFEAIAATQKQFPDAPLDELIRLSLQRRGVR